MMGTWADENEKWDAMGGGLDSSVEGQFLHGIARRVARPGMVGFDTGCFTGWTAAQVLDVFCENDGFFWCVDWFKGAPNSVVAGLWWKPEADKDPTKKAFVGETVLLRLLKNLDVLEAGDHVGVMVSESWRPAQFVSDKSVDYVYVGGDHRYSGIMRDLTAWVPKIRPGGVICGHAYDRWLEVGTDQWKSLCAEPEQDYYHHANCHFGVNRALAEMFHLKGFSIEFAGNCWAVFL